MAVDDLPEDSLLEILARLPVESLLRFLCVCKSWYALIKSPSFVTTHFNYASDDDKASRIVVIHEKYRTPYITTVLSNDGVQIYHDLSNSFLLDMDDKHIYFRLIVLSSSCNGVICVCDYEGYVVERVALWNPAIREVNYLVLDDGIAVDKGYSEQSTLIGFGLDTKSNVYKVVRCRQFLQFLPPFKHYFVVDIYDVGNNDSWRKLDATDLPGTGHQGGSMYADGFCYWHLYFNSDDQSVLSFDFSNEVFEWIPRPPGGTHMGRRPSMATFGESVAYVGSNFDHDCIIVWMLSREGDKKTWIKQFSLPKHYDFFPQFLRSGKIVVPVHDQVHLYDPTTQHDKKLMDLRDINVVQITNYVESLISFKKYFPPPYPKQQISA